MKIELRAASQTWSGGALGNNTAWLTNGNWVGGSFPGSQSASSNADVGTIPSTGTNPDIGINLNFSGNTFYLGAINFNGSSRGIGDSSATAGTLQLNGATVNGVGNTILRNAGTGTLTIQAAQNGTMGLSLGNTTNNVVAIDGTGGITISSVISGVNRNFSRVGTGSGSLSLTGANTFSGSTSVAGGVLSAAATNALGGTTAIIVSTGGTLLLSNALAGSRINDSATVALAGGTFNTSGLSETVGALTQTSASIIDFGTSLSSILRFAGLGGGGLTGTLSIYNWTGSLLGGIFPGNGTDQLYIGNGITLNAGQLAQIVFYSDNGVTSLGSATQLASGEVVPIPEPSTYLAGALLAGAVGWHQRRRWVPARAASAAA